MNRVQSDFSIALIQLKKGEKVTRASWPEDQYLEIHETSEGAYIALCHNTTVFDWLPGEHDLLAIDWVQLT